MSTKQQLIDKVNEFYQKVVLPTLKDENKDLIQPYVNVFDFKNVRLKDVYNDTVEPTNESNDEEIEFKTLVFVFEDGKNQKVELAVVDGNLSEGILDLETTEITYSLHDGTEFSKLTELKKASKEGETPVYQEEEVVKDYKLSELLTECGITWDFLDQYLTNNWWKLEEEFAANETFDLTSIQKIFPSIIDIKAISTTRIEIILSSGLPNEGRPLEINKSDLEVAIENAATHK